MRKTITGDLFKNIGSKVTFLIIAALMLLLGSSHAGMNHDEFILVSIPKCGTHLIAKALTRLLEKKVYNPLTSHPSKEKLGIYLQNAKEENCYVRMHLFPSKKMTHALMDLNCKVVFIYRDPRDMAVSLLHWIDSGKGRYGPLDIENPDYASLTQKMKLLEIITGERFGYSGIKEIFERRTGWLRQEPDKVFSLKFEELVGENGGGSNVTQKAVVNQVAAFLGISLSETEIAFYSKDLFGKPGEGTFRKGLIGEWKSYFGKKHKNVFKQVFGSLLIELGYENNFDW